jgi:catechol 2,3-dioxygenase-like lactoylglutathione lyase family enzyme
MTRVLETCLYCADLGAAERFYGEFIGLEKIVRVDDRHVFYRAEGSVLLVFNPDETEIPPPADKLPVPPHGARGPGHVCFAADGDDLDRWRERIEAAGFEIESEFEWPQGGRSIYIRDPAGNSVEFAESRIWGL